LNGHEVVDRLPTSLHSRDKPDRAQAIRATTANRCQEKRAALYLPGATMASSTTKLLKGRKPTVDIAARLIFCQPISLLKPTFQLIVLAIHSGSDHHP